MPGDHIDAGTGDVAGGPDAVCQQYGSWLVRRLPLVLGAGSHSDRDPAASLWEMSRSRGGSLESATWTPGKALRHVEQQLTGWGFTAPAQLEPVVRLLAATVVADGGRRISPHLSEQNGLALVLCLSHQQTAEHETTDMLTALRNLGTDSCGTEMTDEGRQVWALLLVQAAAAPTGRTA
ncbi:hypothetical protein [Streptomyces sp. NPDC046939]|uniref:hypothetical protein n=1 Tax=Streptomyces sp. NPDC046939 TaxID=3155376 RepID=UPI0033D0BD34